MNHNQFWNLATHTKEQYGLTYKEKFLFDRSSVLIKYLLYKHIPDELKEELIVTLNKELGHYTELRKALIAFMTLYLTLTKKIDNEEIAKLWKDVKEKIEQTQKTA